MSSSLNVGAKVLAAINGGRIGLFGRPVGRRWTRLAEDSPAGSNQAVLLDQTADWQANQSVILMSSSYNPWQVGSRLLKRWPVGVAARVPAPGFKPVAQQR